MKWFFLALAIISEIIGTTALKMSNGFTKVTPSIIVVICYCSAFFFLSLTLKYIPVGIAYAIWSGIGIVVISLIGFWGFNQKLDLPAIVGIILIVTGVIVINLFSKSTSV